MSCFFVARALGAILSVITVCIVLLSSGILFVLIEKLEKLKERDVKKRKLLHSRLSEIWNFLVLFLTFFVL